MPRKTPAPPLVPPDFVRRRYHAVLPPSDALALEALFALRTGMQALDTIVARWLGDDALTPGRWQVLAVLWSRGEPVPQREIVGALKVSRANVSMLVDALQTEGHVEALSDPADRRQVLVSLTPTGRAVTDRLMRETAGKLRGSLALDDGELRVLTDLVMRLLA
ncbi:MarR family winged helix-turn-helix transcriptional regulator [Methylobacterium platani]|uniref:MarR family winged helix-turn-helix transcriptional regulator n=1 Tax=Methylobacterium platani TaxID=427683 RepID=UPI00069F2FE7|nr:MarR family winged helix-turn-helix transcriptional regulator [Methylobacterium platani]